MAHRRSSAVVLLGITAVLASALSGCAAAPDYQGVCKDKTTGMRLDDIECKDDNAGYMTGSHFWYFYGAGRTVPPIGSALTGGMDSVPAGASAIRGGMSAKGGTVSRGGFGGSHGGGIGG